MDLIDRREAMAELYDVFFDDDLKAAYPDKADVVLDVIRKLPSAQADGDTISRQAAIDTEGLDEQIRCEMCRNPMHTDRGCDGNCKYDEKLYGRIMQILGERIKPLPPAQPKRCSDCIAHGGDWECDYMHCRKGRLPSAQSERTEERTETHACDCISRQAAITTIQKAYADTEGGTDKCAVWKNVGLTNALHIMQDLPSAQPERKKGRWIRNDNGTYSCSVCQSWIPEEQHYYARYCLYCGTDMMSENNE